ncbi:MAG TPA: hypothetical protein VMU65_10025 [Candidatus Saccharimonadales bacterium]|nr:hypothetical protein [Candidatus Saccharimonadales bacterium]
MRLFDLSIDRTGRLPLRGELPLGTPRDNQDHADRQRHGDERHRGQQGADPQHHGKDSNDGEQRGEQLAQPLLQGRGHVVDVVGDAAEQVPVRMAVEVLQRQAAQLLLDVPAHSVDRSLSHPRHQVPLTPAEEGTEQIQQRDTSEDEPELGEVDPPAGDDVHSRQQLGERPLATPVQECDHLGLRHPGRECFADDPIEDHVGGAPDEPGGGDGERNAH